MTCNLDLSNVPLTRQEYIDCMKEKLDFNVIKRLNSAFENHTPVLNWDNVSIVQIKKILLVEFGSKEPDISAVLGQFASSSIQKSKEMSVAKFYHLWKEQLPDVLQPSTPEDNKKCVDLIQQ